MVDNHFDPAAGGSDHPDGAGGLDVARAVCFKMKPGSR
jgi:hypothetical protein